MVNGQTVGYRNGTLGLVFKRRVPTTNDQRQLAVRENLQRLIVMTDNTNGSKPDCETGGLKGMPMATSLSTWFFIFQEIQLSLTQRKRRLIKFASCAVIDESH